jgi:hypothetical protein
VQHETFNFSFVLRNPAASRSRQNVYAVASITSVRDKTQTLAVMESESKSRNTQVGSSAHQVVLSDLNAMEHMFRAYERDFALANVSFVMCPANCTNETMWNMQNCTTNSSLISSTNQKILCLPCPINCTKPGNEPPPYPAFPSFSTSLIQGRMGRRRRDDDDYGVVREIRFSTRFAQQSTRAGVSTNKATDPCSPTTISITLATSVPFLTACPTNVTISGFKDHSGVAGAAREAEYFFDLMPISNFTLGTRYPYPSHTNLPSGGTTPTDSSNTFTYIRGSFDKIDGSFIMSVDQNTVAGQEYTITFPMLQRADPDSGVDSMRVSSNGVANGATVISGSVQAGAPEIMHLGSGEAHPLKVNQLVF